MSGSISVKLPVKNYLKKYLTKKFGDSYRVNRTDWVGKYLIDLLDKQYRRKGTIKEDAFYKIEVPSSVVKEVGFDMSVTKMRHFESMIDKVFRSELETFIDVSISSNLYFNVNSKFHKLSVMKAMQQFLETFEISEDDIKLESLYRNFARKKKHPETPANVGVAG